MILTLIIGLFFTLLTVLFGLVSIPGMPVIITAAFGYALDFMNLPLQIVKAYVGHEFFIACITAIIVIANAERVWALIQWLWHKIRG